MNGHADLAVHRQVIDAWTSAAVVAALAESGAQIPRTITANVGPSGLTIHVGTRAATWRLRFSIRGRGQRTISLGDVDPDRVPDILARAADIITAGRAGRDVDADAVRQGERALGGLVDEFCMRMAPRSRDERKTRLVRALGPLIDRAALSITRADLAARLAGIDGPASRWRAASDFRGLFRWLAAAEVIDRDPALPLKATRPPPRQNRPALADMRMVLRAADTLDPDVAAFLAFQALTGSRRSEARFATAGELDLQARLWKIPATRAKNGMEHHVHLGTAALALVIAQLRRKGPLTRKSYLFGPHPDQALTEADLARLFTPLWPRRLSRPSNPTYGVAFVDLPGFFARI